MEPGTGIALAALGLVGGLTLLARGLAAYRRGQRLADIATSRVASLAAGEVRISGQVVAAGVTLVSPLQSQPCVYYDATITESSGDGERTILHRERSVGFFVDDGSGRIRVFPRGARWGVPSRLDERGDADGRPPAVLVNTGPDSVASELDREAAVAALLTVRPARPVDDDDADGFGTVLGGQTGSRRQRRYMEARLEPGETVTVVGSAVPFAHLDDPEAADVWQERVLAPDDAEVAANIAAARAAGRLTTAEQAWGNAAIPGFGIGRPAISPVLDAGATPLPLGDPDAVRRARETFEIDPDQLVLAAMDESPLAVYAGAPAEAHGQERSAFLLGLAGASVAIVAAVALAVLVGGMGG